MKKLTAAISTACIGVAGLGTAVAGIPDFECNSSGTACAGPDLYEVSLNCVNLEAPVGGGLEIGWDGTGTFDVFVFDDGGIVCDMDGYMDSSKTEGKCTEAPNGPNKNVGKNKHGTGYPQVDFEVKLGEEGALECAPV